MPLNSNSSPSSEYNQLLTVFKGHFSNHLNLSRIRLVCYFIVALCKIKSVNYSKLSAGFDGPAGSASNFRRIQRFMAQVDFSMELVAKLIFSLMPNKDALVLVLDRTNWKFGTKNINVLMLGVAYNGIAFPIMFKMLDKKGNSNTDERIGLLCDFMNWFGKDCIDCLLADREFVGALWLEFLHMHKIKYHIRIRNNFQVLASSNAKAKKAYNRFRNLKIGELRIGRKKVTMHGISCYLSAISYLNNGKPDYLIIASMNKPEESLAYYKQRWQIETLFKGLKSSGFNIEDTHVTDLERLGKLLRLTMIAFTWCYRIGDHLNNQVKAIKIKKHGRKAVSVFKYGLEYLSRVFLSRLNQHKINVFKFLSCT